MFIIELRDSGVVNVTRDNVSLETNQRKSRLRSKPRTYMDSYSRNRTRLDEFRQTGLQPARFNQPFRELVAGFAVSVPTGL